MGGQAQHYECCALPPLNRGIEHGIDRPLRYRQR